MEYNVTVTVLFLRKAVLILHLFLTLKSLFVVSANKLAMDFHLTHHMI